MTQAEFEIKFNEQMAKIDGFDLSELDHNVHSFVTKFLFENLTTKGDKIIIDADTINVLRKLNKSLQKYIDSDPLMNEFVTKAIQSMVEASGAQSTFFSAQETPVSKSAIKLPQKLIVDNMADSFTNLNEALLQPMKKLIVDNLTSSASKSMLEEQLKQHLIGTGEIGKFGRYVKTIAQYSADAYTGTVNKQQFEQYKAQIRYIRISGSLIKTSSVQCAKCVKFYHRNVPIEDFKNVVLPLAADNGLIEGTTIDNVFTNKLHYGCRHNFYAIT